MPHRQWNPLGLYVKSGPQTTIDLTMGLGNFGALNLGTADFDAVIVTQVSAIPNGAPVVDLATVVPPPAAASTSQYDFTVGIWGFICILVVIGLAAAVYVMWRRDPVSALEADTAPKADVESESHQGGAAESPGDFYADSHQGSDSKSDRAD